MSLSAAAAALGLPEVLVQRSAEARAAETGTPVDDILTAWAGGETVEGTPAPEPEAETPAEVLEPAEAEVAAPVAAAIVTSPETAPTPVTTRAPALSEVTPAEASHLPEVITVPTAGIKERTNFVIPKWLTAVMLIVPLFALFALGGASTGECGEATELETDVVSGEIVNCDGSQFTGSEIGGGGTDFIAQGRDIYSGAAVSGVNCAGCHGANGQGGGSFPSLAGSLTTFGSCADHIEWVAGGSAAFTEQGTYGDTSKPVSGGMPAFGGSLSPSQIAAVSAFERVRFGGDDPETALVDCGLVDESSGEGGDEPNTEGGGDGAMEDSTDASTARIG